MDLDRFRHFRRDTIAEGFPQVFRRIADHAAHPSLVRRGVRVEQAKPQEAVDIAALRKGETLPVDHRSAEQHKAQGFHVKESEGIEAHPSILISS